MVDSYSVEPYKENSEMSFQEYLAKYAKVTGEIAPTGFLKYYDRVYEEVKERFKIDPEVELCRMTSDEWFEQFMAAKGHGNNEMLDWIYIDGDHSYEGCLKDLENSLNVVKPGGLILGDDYGWPNAKWFKPGVTKAVDEFINKHKLTKMLRHGETQYEIRI